MAATLVLAVAADGEVGVMRQRRERRDVVSRIRDAHLAAIAPREGFPSRRRERLGHHPAEQLEARREVREPNVVVIELRVIALLHAARRLAHGAEPQALAFLARRAQTDDAHAHANSSSISLAIAR